jgi:hypothetical protein
VLGGDTLGLMAEQDHRRCCGGRQARERDCALGQLNGEDPPPAVALRSDPAVLAGVEPVDAAALGETPRVADGQRVAVVRGVGNRDARAGGVACAQQCPEVGLVGDPRG